MVEQKFSAQKRKGNPYAAFVFEPLIQGAAGMIPQPDGWLRQVTDIACAHGALLIADEVMTGFGRANSKFKIQNSKLPVFTCQEENVQPDFLCLAKGLTSGYLPMAATLTTQKVFDAFLGEYGEFKTFFHGHSSHRQSTRRERRTGESGDFAEQTINHRAAKAGAVATRGTEVALVIAECRRRAPGRSGRGN